MKELNQKTLLVGWDGADWDIVIPLIDTGKLPNLERLITHGVSGRLLTIHPAISPMLWTTIATGKLPHKHGVLGFVEPDESGNGIRPITNLSRKCKAIWNILNESGRRSAVLGWWPSHPVEPINGVMVSNRYQLPAGDSRETWPLPPECIHPERLRAPLEGIRVHPSDIAATDILPFIPNAAKIDNPSADPRISGLARILAENATVHSAATAALQLEEWDFCAVYFDAIDHLSHGFMQYHPPLAPGVPESDYDLFKDVVEGAYIFQDMMLGTLLDIVGDSTTVFLVSDHGFKSGDARKHAPKTHGGPVVQHADYGMIVIRGEGFRKDSLIHGSSIADVTPTILHHLGLPIGRDMDGRVLTQAFVGEEEISFIDSWETTQGDAGTHPPNKQSDAIDHYEAIAQLTALGYIDSPGSDRTRNVQNASRELRFNLATAYMAAGMHDLAIPILELLWEESPMESRFGNKLMHCHIAMKHPEDTRKTFEKMLSNKKESAAAASASLKLLKRKYADKPLQEWSGEDRAAHQVLWKASRTNLDAMAFLRGWVLWAENRHEEAIQVLRQVDLNKIFDPESYFRLLAECHLELNETSESRSCFQRVLEFNQDNADAFLGLARCSFATRKYREASKLALQSISLRYFNPRAHFLYGTCLYRCNRPKEAVNALLVSVQQHPRMLAALQRLALLYGRIFGDKEKEQFYCQQVARVKSEELETARLEGKKRASRTSDAADVASVLESALEAEIQAHRNAVRRIPEQAKDVLIVVSGLPRSGTSMMMQLLASGGVSVLHDGQRSPDISNPKGYYELERVKSLQEDGTWLRQETGNAVKIVVPLLRHIPDDIYCRVIFMNRRMEDIVESQDRMLRSRNNASGIRSQERIVAGYKRAMISDLQMLRSRNNVETYIADYDDFVDRTALSVERLSGFLKVPCLNHDLMIEAVDPELRHRDITIATKLQQSGSV